MLSPLRETVQFIHQTGFDDYQRVAMAYEERRFLAQVAPFINDMAAVYRKASLVVSRAGAITLAELLVSGKPSVLIPYPHAAYNHQEINARAVVAKGAATMILDKDLHTNALANAILDLYHDSKLLQQIGIKARELAKPEAAQSIVNLLTG